MRRAFRLTLIFTAAGLITADAARAGEPSPEFQANLKRTLELRKQRRRRVATAPQPVGAIVPYPFPPALIIRQSPEVHDEIGALLDALRRSSG